MLVLIREPILQDKSEMEGAWRKGLEERRMREEGWRGSKGEERNIDRERGSERERGRGVRFEHGLGVSYRADRRMIDQLTRG